MRLRRIEPLLALLIDASPEHGRVDPLQDLSVGCDLHVDEVDGAAARRIDDERRRRSFDEDDGLGGRGRLLDQRQQVHTRSVAEHRIQQHRVETTSGDGRSRRRDVLYRHAAVSHAVDGPLQRAQVRRRLADEEQSGGPLRGRVLGQRLGEFAVK